MTTQQSNAQNIVTSRSHTVLRALYGVVDGLALALHLFVSVLLWIRSIQSGGVCGNPLLEMWSLWFVISAVLGLVMLPGGLWAWKRREQPGAFVYIYGAGFLVYAASMLVTLVAGLLVWRTVPYFFLVPPW